MHSSAYLTISAFNKLLTTVYPDLLLICHREIAEHPNLRDLCFGKSRQLHALAAVTCAWTKERHALKQFLGLDRKGERGPSDKGN